MRWAIDDESKIRVVSSTADHHQVRVSGRFVMTYYSQRWLEGIIWKSNAVLKLLTRRGSTIENERENTVRLTVAIKFLKYCSLYIRLLILVKYNNRTGNTDECVLSSIFKCEFILRRHRIYMHKISFDSHFKMNKHTLSI